jgi:PAS domain S-box-containing protein
MNSLPQVSWIVLSVLLLALYSDKEANGTLKPEAWCEEVTTPRRLAENGLPRTDSEATGLQWKLPLDATGCDRAQCSPSESDQRQSLIRGWLWTSIGGAVLVLLITLGFLQRLRRLRREIQSLNIGLEQQVRVRTAELRQQVSNLRTLIDTLPVAVWLKDAERRYLIVNATYNHLYRQEDAQIIGQTDEALWPGRIGERLRESDLEVMATRQQLSMEIIMPDSSGVPFWRELDKAPVLDDDGSLLGMVGISRDISERKEAEQKLKQALEFSEGVINAIPDLLFEMDISGRYLNVWTHTPELLAVQKEMLLGKTVNDTLSAESAATVMDCLSEAEREGLSFGKVICNDLPQGETWFELSVSKKQASAPSEATFLVLSRDISERIRLETELLDSRNFLNRLLDEVPDPIFVKDRKHCWILLNDAFCKLTGQPRELLLGKSDYDFFPREEAKVFWEMDERVFESDEINMNEERFTSADGTRHFVQTKKTPFVASGSRKMLVGVIRDITQRKSYEEAREVALDEARRLARSRSEFLAKMSHELRSPLNSILGYAQILGNDRSLDEAYRSKINVIQDSGEHLLMLINDILDFAKSESDRIELYKSDVPTAFFLQTTADIVRAKAEAKGLTFVTEFAAELPEYIHVDEKRLQQVLLNLLSNAVKFTEQGKVRLQIDFTPPQTLHICVGDSGIGIAADRLDTIFQPFEQDTEQRYRFGGTGLGLSISRELIRLMGGEIQVESTPGQGSLFCFEIEVGICSPGDEVFDVNSGICGYLGEPKTLLVVDDLAENRAVVRDMLTPFGFRILEAVDGQDGLEKTKSKRPDLILMDINMPDVNGLEIMRRLRKMPGLGLTPIIAMSASVSNDDQAACMAAGADAFLANPLHLQRTLWQIGALLRLEWQYESAEQDSAEEKPEQVPDTQALKDLLWLAEIGDMHGIIKHVDQLLEAEPGYGGFCRRLRSLAESYQTKAVLTFVQQYLEGEHG